jgi:hypothetical protein
MACSNSEFIFWNIWIYFGRLVGFLERGISRSLPTEDNATQKNADSHIHAPNRIRTHNPSFRTVEDSTCLTLRGRWDRLNYITLYYIILNNVCVGESSSSGISRMIVLIYLVILILQLDFNKLHDIVFIHLVILILQLDFNKLHAQNGSGAYPASYPVGTKGSFPRVNRPGREADHSPPSSAEVKNAWRYTSAPPVCLHGVVLS